jgi:hypothetical protein
MFTFEALDLLWYPHRLLVVDLMLANQRKYTSPPSNPIQITHSLTVISVLDDTPYSKSDWADVSGIPLEMLRHFELRCLVLTDFRLLQPPQGGWDLFLKGTKDWLANLKWEWGALWPEESALPSLSLLLEISPT